MTFSPIPFAGGRLSRNTRLPALAAMALAVAALSVHAGDSVTGPLGFKDLDANGDGRLDTAEAARHHHLKDNFGAVDSDGDGYISERDFALGVPATNEGRPTESWFTKPAHKPE